MDKILCVGKNYLQHALELGDALPTEPLYFIKPPSAAYFVTGGTAEIELPRERGEVHHELELVLRLELGANGFYFSHYTFGLDLTLRDLQSHLKKAGQPWEKAKVFKNAAILGEWFPIADVHAILDFSFTLAVNGKMRQQGRGKEMRWTPDALLVDLPRWFPLIAGDALFTGTPAGVGPLQAGDQAEVRGGEVRYAVTFI